MISPVYVYSFTYNDDSIVNNSQLRMDDDKEDDISSTDDPKCSLIPNGLYPLVTEGTLNYFDSSPQGRVSHSGPKKQLS